MLILASPGILDCLSQLLGRIFEEHPEISLKITLPVWTENWEKHLKCLIYLGLTACVTIFIFCIQKIYRLSTWQSHRHEAELGVQSLPLFSCDCLLRLVQTISQSAIIIFFFFYFHLHYQTIIITISNLDKYLNTFFFFFQSWPGSQFLNVTWHFQESNRCPWGCIFPHSYVSILLQWSGISRLASWILHQQMCMWEQQLFLILH